MENVQYIPIELLVSHPDNPRLFMREEVVNSIVAQLEDTKTYDPAHALLVRPFEDGYQIIQGHHRVEAARKVGLTEIPAWVREMSDEDAYMQLVLGNMQGELSPLEIGIHAYGAVEPAQGKEGLGIQEYATLVGKTRSYISQLRSAAEVLKEVPNLVSQLTNLIDKSQHLYEISKAPREVWPILVEYIKDTQKADGKIEKGWTVNQTEDKVKDINKFIIPEEWQQVHLGLVDVITNYLKTGIPTPSDVTRLVVDTSNVVQLVEGNTKNIGDSFPYSIEEFHQWLKEGVGTYSWDIRKIQEYKMEVVQTAQELSKPPEPDPQLGEWWQLGKHRLYCGDTSTTAFINALPEGAFAFADPPYVATDEEWDQDFEWAHDYLADKAVIVAVTPGISAIQNFFAHDTTMPYRWSMASWISNGMTRGALGFGNWLYIALFSHQDSIHKKSQDVLPISIRNKKTVELNYKGKKPDELLDALLSLFTAPGDVVIDPFLGTGTTLFSAENLGRVCVGGEIQPELCKKIILNWQENTGLRAEKLII